MIGLSAEQLLSIADEVCEVFSVQVHNFSALCAASAVTTASIDGIRVHGDGGAGRELARTILLLKPLTSHNDVFAAVAAEVLEQLNQ